MDNLERSIFEHEKIVSSLKPPVTLEDAIKPGDLAALVAPGRWEPLREIRQRREAALALTAQIAGKLSEVEETLRGLDARRPRDVARLADSLLSGEPMAPEPEPEKPVGLAALGREALTAAKAGLQQKRAEAEADAEWQQRQAKVEEAKILEEALKKAGERYAEIVRDELAPLHVLIDAGAGLLSAGRREPVLDTHAWRNARFLAPPFQDPRQLLEGDYGHGRTILAKFETGAGLSGATEAWRRAVKSAVGVNSL